jgi:hypothetical protein
MARYVLTADTTLDGLTLPRGTIINAPHNLATVIAHIATLDDVPRARLAGLEFFPTNYVAVPVADQIGRQQSTLALPEEGTIKEPVLPTENSQYD